MQMVNTLVSEYSVAIWPELWHKMYVHINSTNVSFVLHTQ